MKDKIINVIKLLICFLFFIYVRSISELVLNLFDIDLNSLSNKGVAIYQFAVSFIIFIMIIILYYGKLKIDYINFKKDKKKNIIYVIKMYALFMILKYVFSIISVVLLVIFGYDTTLITSINQELIEKYVKAAPLLMVISSAFLAPFYEEGIFRLGIKEVIKNKYVFVLLSGLVFGLMHIFPLEEGISLSIGLIQSITYVSMGIMLAYIYHKKDNIYMSMGLHFLNNFLSVLVMINMI